MLHVGAVWSDKSHCVNWNSSCERKSHSDHLKQKNCWFLFSQVLLFGVVLVMTNSAFHMTPSEQKSRLQLRGHFFMEALRKTAVKESILEVIWTRFLATITTPKEPLTLTLGAVSASCWGRFMSPPSSTVWAQCFTGILSRRCTSTLVTFFEQNQNWKVLISWGVIPDWFHNFSYFMSQYLFTLSVIVFNESVLFFPSSGANIKSCFYNFSM